MSDAWSRPWTQIRQEQVPAKARAVALEIVAQLDSVREQTSHPSPGSREGRFRASDGHGGIAILGDRGSGKSTVLHAACGEIASRDTDVVLPVVYPELFRETDSVLGTFLAHLWDRAPGASDPFVDSGGKVDEDSDLVRLILDAAHIYAMARTPARALENTALGAEYTDEAVAITRSSTRLHRILAEVTRAVSVSAGGGLLILPIDDADLSPLGVSGIMRDLRILGSIPGIMPIACASDADLRTSWIREQGIDAASPQQVSSFRRFMEKLFPYRFRFEIEPLLAGERVSFTPIGTQASVADITMQFDEAVERVSGGVLPLRPLRQAQPSISLVNPLPPNPRALIQVWDSLEAAVKQDSVVAISTALRRTIQVLGEPIDDATDAAAVPPFATITPLGNAAGPRYKVDFDVNHWNLFIGAARFASTASGAVFEAAEATSQSRIQLRRLTGVFSSLSPLTANDVSVPTTASSKRQMSSEVTSALLTIQELVNRSNLMESNLETPVYLGHTDYAFLQSVEIAGLNTDDYFITLPDLATFSTVVSGAERWNQLVDRLRDGPDIATALSLSLSFAMAQVSEDWEVPESIPGYSQVFNEVTREFLAALDIEVGSRTDEHRRLIEWYTQGPPLHWHPAFLPAATIAEVVTIWSGACSRLTDDDARVSPMQLLKARIERILDSAESSRNGVADHVWIAGYLSAVAKEVDDKMYRRLAQIYPMWRQRWTIIRTGSASALLSLEEERTGDAVSFSPYPTQHGIDLLDSALTELRRLRARAARGEISLQQG